MSSSGIVSNVRIIILNKITNLKKNGLEMSPGKIIAEMLYSGFRLAGCKLCFSIFLQCMEVIEIRGWILIPFCRGCQGMRTRDDLGRTLAG